MIPTKKPSITAFMMGHIVLVSMVSSLLFYLLLFESNQKNPWLFFGAYLLIIALLVAIAYDKIIQIQHHLDKINTYLEDAKYNKTLEENQYISKEFALIDRNLGWVIKNAKKREDDKQKYNAKLKLKNRQRSDMLSAIAHEFRNPISAIIGYAQTLQEDDSIAEPIRHKFLSRIYTNGGKIESLLSRLILWNKFESGDTKLKLSSFDLGRLLGEIEIDLEEKYKDREILLTGESRIINADRDLIGIVLRNLIENALKYSQDQVEVTLTPQKVIIQDYGVGIASHDINKVTKKFFRSGTHSWDNSMGLGLSIVKSILLLHGSDLELSSKLGIGSKFEFKI